MTDHFGHRETASNMRRMYVLVPGTKAWYWQGGGLNVTRHFQASIGNLVDAKLVTYDEREDDTPFLDDVLAFAQPADVFLITWGPHAQGLLDRLADRHTIYYAQSVGWRLAVPPSTPILCVSRFLMAHWQLHAPRSPIFLLPPVVDERCALGETPDKRDIDVLFIDRKASAYVKHRLAPALQSRCNVHVVSDFIDKAALIALYQRTKVYVYGSDPSLPIEPLGPGPHPEGFGLQPLEALLCGCVVFSSLNGGLADYLEPQHNALKLGSYNLQHDVDRVLEAVAQPHKINEQNTAALRASFSQAAFDERVRRILPAIDRFFSYVDDGPCDIELPTRDTKSVAAPTPRPGVVERIARKIGDKLAGS